MKDEFAEIRVQQRTKQVITSFYEEQGPDDEFRPVKISIVTTTRTQANTEEETRDEGVVEVLQRDDERENIYETEYEKSSGREEAVVEENYTQAEAIEVRHNSMEENGVVVEASDSPFSTSKQSESDENRSYVSELSKSKSQESIEAVEDHSDITDTISSPTKNVSLFDTSLLEQIEDSHDDEEVDADDLSVVSKSVVDESKKNAEEAEALAQEMKRQLAESLAGYSDTPSPRHLTSETQTGQQDSQNEQQLPSSSSSISAHSSSSRTSIKSSSKIVKIESSAFMNTSEVGISDQRVELPIVNATPESASSSSVVSSSSTDLSTSTPRRRHRFRHRRPSTASWTSADAAAYNDSSVHRAVNRLPITQQQQHILASVVIPAVFLVAAVAICKTYFDSWLRVGDGNSNAWALTWTLLCIIAVVAPVFALEYLLLGGVLTGTVVKEALTMYPEVKRFLRDVRRMRLKAGWWYPSEVRTLRRDLDASNAELLSQQQSKLNEKFARDSEEDDVRSIRRQMSREEHRKEKAQLEKIFDVERSEWLATKDDLVGDVVAQKEKNAMLEEELKVERQKQAQVVAQKEQLENNIEVERAQWKYSRLSLEEALKTAVAAQNDNSTSKDFFTKMETAHEEERLLWEKEREGFQLTMKKAQEDARMQVKEHEAKIRLLDEMRAAKQSQWDTERRSLKARVQNAINEAKEVKDALDSQICKLMDANDEKYEKEIEKITEKFVVQKKTLEQMLEDAKGEQEVSLRCVQNLQALLEEERAEWKIERETLMETCESIKAKHAEIAQRFEKTEGVFEEERTTWEKARTTFEEALEATSKGIVNSSSKNEMRRVKKSFQEELKTKESKIKALEESMAQLENIIRIQERIELSTNGTTHNTASREANNKLKPVAYIVPEDGVEVKLQSSSKDLIVQKIQETNNMLKQWQDANHHVRQLLATSQAMLEASSFASEDSEGDDNFHNTIVTYTAASEAAKAYLEKLVTKTGHEDLLEVHPVGSLVFSSSDSGSLNEETNVNDSSLRSTRSVAVVANPWLMNAPLWQQVWSSLLMARMSPFRLCTTAMQTVCSGIFGGAFKMFRKSAKSKEKTDTIPPATAETPTMDANDYPGN